VASNGATPSEQLLPGSKKPVSLPNETGFLGSLACSQVTICSLEFAGFRCNENFFWFLQIFGRHFAAFLVRKTRK
jgi:hypothetical protein